MNRIILIGNGFDLAHGLQTRYEDFINWYWDKWVVKLIKCNDSTLSDEICSFSIKSGRNTWSCFMYTSGYTLSPPKGVDFVNNIAEDKSLQITQSPLLTRICKSIQDKNWVDIEWEYYNLLRNRMLVPGCYDYTIAELNGHLRYIQELLVQYLSSTTNIAINYNERIFQQIFSNIRKNDISISQLPAYYDYVEYLISHTDDEYKFILGRYGLENSDIYFKAKELKELHKNTDTIPKTFEVTHLKDLIRPANIMLLNFNYTGVADIYGTTKVSTVNHIHGDLSNPDSIIFGYGDELDDDYKE
ncbi:MAG: hypothetical protein HDS68_09420, partial [Bacteroidales bacterium]|nr:hypothetical protein [Bacteroidales bacterium]